MKLLVITPHYLPDGGPSAPLYTMLCEALLHRGHEVTVIASAPHYPSGRVPKEYRGWRSKRTIESGVTVIRVPIPSVNRANLALRLFQFVWYQVGITLAGLRQEYEVMLSSNPALQVGLPFTVLAVLYRKPAIFSVHDVYPDAGVALGVFRHRAVVAVVTWMEQLCLHYATRVRILSESFISGMKALGVPEEKLELIYDWVDTDLIQPMPRETAFAREHGLQKKFVVLYAGNMGLSQGLDHVLTAAERLASHADLQFVFVGEGASRDRLIADVERRRLTNVTFLPFQPRARLPEVLATADVSLVILQKGIGFRSLPSKSFSIFASGRPLLASLDEGSDSWNVIVRSRGGLCVPPEDPDRLAEAILRLKNNPELCQKLGQNGREFALQNHSPQAAAQHFERLLEEAMACRALRRT